MPYRTTTSSACQTVFLHKKCIKNKREIWLSGALFLHFKWHTAGIKREILGKHVYMCRFYCFSSFCFSTYFVSVSPQLSLFTPNLLLHHSFPRATSLFFFFLQHTCNIHLPVFGDLLIFFFFFSSVNTL